MSIEQVLVLALIQGITEFLPISSSGHLLLIPVITGWPDQGLTTDVMIHMGSFLAVVVYFWRDVIKLIGGGLDLLRGRLTDWGKLALFTIIATVPAALVGAILDKVGVMDAARNMPPLVAWNAILFGLLLYLCDRYSSSTKNTENMTIGQAIFIGMAQAIAIIPGVSRSGITMSAGRLLGFTRAEATRLSFLIGIPTIGGAGILKLGTAFDSGELFSWEQLITAILTFFVALGTIAVLMKLVTRVSFLPFAIYRVTLGGLLLVLISYGYALRVAS